MLLQAALVACPKIRDPGLRLPCSSLVNRTAQQSRPSGLHQRDPSDRKTDPSDQPVRQVLLFGLRLAYPSVRLACRDPHLVVRPACPFAQLVRPSDLQPVRQRDPSDLRIVRPAYPFVRPASELRPPAVQHPCPFAPIVRPCFRLGLPQPYPAVFQPASPSCVA